MKSSFRAMTLLVVAVGLFLIVGAASMATAGSQAKVTINVAALRPGSSEDAQKQFNDNVALFERQHPNIDVKAVEYAWNGATFAAQLAAGRLPTVFTVPFTDARTLGEHRQVADLTAGVKKWPYFHKFQKTIIAEATTSKGRIIGVPYAAYAQALHYNRALFRQAGLNPNKPPTTWAQLRKYAKQISDRTGAAGYAQMGLNDNTAGWIATTVTYTLGGRMEKGRGTSATATLNNPFTVQGLNLLRQMRWNDKSMGSTFDYTWPTINQAFAAGKIDAWAIWTGPLEMAEVQYKVSTPYNGATECAIRWNDPDIGVAWPLSEPVLSARDQTSESFAELNARLGLAR